MNGAQINTLILSIAAFIIIGLLSIIAYFLKEHFDAWKLRNIKQSELEIRSVVHDGKHESTEKQLGEHDETLKEHSTKLNRHDRNFSTLGIEL